MSLESKEPRWTHYAIIPRADQLEPRDKPGMPVAYTVHRSTAAAIVEKLYAGDADIIALEAEWQVDY